MSTGLKARGFIVVLLGGAAVWAGLTNPWLAPGLGALVVGQAFLGLSWARSSGGHPSTTLVLVFLTLSYLGLVSLMATVAGRPTTDRFWIVFAAGAAIFVPVALLAWTSFRSLDE